MGYAPSIVSSVRYQLMPVDTGTGTSYVSPVTGSGAYGALLAVGTTAFDWDGFWLDLYGLTNQRQRFSLTANTGGGDEPMVTDIVTAGGQNICDQASLFIPISVPRGALIKAKVWAQGGSGGQGPLSLMGFQGDARMPKGFAQAMAATDFSGFDPANSVALNGTTPTAWTTGMAVTPARFSALIFCADTMAASVGSAALQWDVAVGASGSEQRLFSAFSSYVTGNYPATPAVRGPYPCDIPAGSRLAWRARSYAAATATISAAFLGLTS